MRSYIRFRRECVSETLLPGMYSDPGHRSLYVLVAMWPLPDPVAPPHGCSRDAQSSMRREIADMLAEMQKQIAEQEGEDSAHALVAAMMHKGLRPAGRGGTGAGEVHGDRRWRGARRCLMRRRSAPSRVAAWSRCAAN
jgi:hypothetical protein